MLKNNNKIIIFKNKTLQIHQREAAQLLGNLSITFTKKNNSLSSPGF